MKAGQWNTLVFTWVLLSILASVGPAAAANGTLKGSFVYKNPTTGAEQLLNSGFIYLHSAVKPPPMQKFPSKADYILGPTVSGAFTVSVPEGSYYIRILRRKVVGAVAKPYGPPEEGDFTWFRTAPITITANTTLNLGKTYATLFAASSPVTITGTVKTATGVPLEGRYVRAQTEPCLVPLDCLDGTCAQYGNQCGPAKFLAQRTTDADGNYTLFLADVGTYYIYSSPCLMPGHNDNDATRCQFSAAPEPVTVQRGDRKTVHIVAD